MAGREVGRTPASIGVPDLHSTRDEQCEDREQEDGVATVDAVAEAVASAGLWISPVRQNRQELLHESVSLRLFLQLQACPTMPLRIRAP